MSQRGKLAKFADLHAMPTVLERPPHQAGHWATTFGNKQPIVAELGCGYGEYTIALAQRYPHRNYIGVDIQGERLWRGATAASAVQLNNVRWLRVQIEHLTDYFAPAELAAIWLTFPDPFPKRSQIKKRLSSPGFLSMYRALLQPCGRVYLKTDAADLMTYTHNTIAASGAIIDQRFDDVPAETTTHDLDIITRFERKYRLQGHPIYYCSWHW
jgi:tRNA (guanine-N7-)-methyltransferase